MDKLTLIFSTRIIENSNNNSAKSERKFIDFVISGNSLGQLLEVRKKDLIGTFGWTENIHYENNQIDEFLGLVKPQLKTERTSFYVCPECGDIGCGAITAKIEVKDNVVIWKDFGYENDLEEPNLSDYKKIGPYRFDKTEYAKTLEEIKQRIN